MAVLTQIYRSGVSVPVGPQGVPGVRSAPKPVGRAPSGTSTDQARPLEWWERVAGRWVAQRELCPQVWRRVRELRAVLLWLGLGYLGMLLVVYPAYRGAVKVWFFSLLLLVWWFGLARSKTISWAVVSGLFGVAVLWAPAVARICRQLSVGVVEASRAGAPAPEYSSPATEFAGAATAVAAFGEESLKVLPLVVLAVAAPGWVRRWAVADWLLAGYACGLGFGMFEDGARRVEAAVVKPGLFDLLLGQGPGSGYPQYGWGPLGGGSSQSASDLSFWFAGHQVFSGLIGAGVGFGVVWWRSRRAGWWLAPVVPAMAWWLACVDHFGSNASSQDSGWPAPDAGSVSTVPGPLLWTWRLTGQGFGRAWLLLGLLVMAVVIDTARVRHARDVAAVGSGADGRPGSWSRAVGWVADRALAWPGPARVVVQGVIRVASGPVGGCAASVARDLWLVLAAHARGRDGSGALEPRRVAARRGVATAVMLRRLRMAGHQVLDEPGSAARVRWGRVVVRCVGLLSGVLVAGIVLWWAPRLALAVGPDLTPASDGSWLAGLLDALGEWWGGLSPGTQLAALVGLGVLVGLVTGGLGSAFFVSGVAGYGLGHARGAASLVRDPRAAVGGYLRGVTPMGAVLDVVEVGLTFLPVGAGAAGGRMVDVLARDFARDPAAFLAARRGLVATDGGHVRYDLLTGLKRRNTPAEVAADRAEGVAFNKSQWHRFDVNEVTLGNGKVLDSYNALDEIVSRKQTQLAEVNRSTARKYLAEFTKKYSPGEFVKNTPRARAQFPHLIGERIRGKMYLEVPVQNNPVPDQILANAERKGISIRDTSGHIYR